MVLWCFGLWALVFGAWYFVLGALYLVLGSLLAWQNSGGSRKTQKSTKYQRPKHLRPVTGDFALLYSDVCHENRMTAASLSV